MPVRDRSCSFVSPVITRVVAATALAVLVGVGVSGCMNSSSAQTCVDRGDGLQASASASRAPGAPEIATGYRKGLQPVTVSGFAAATANPLATEAACDVLAVGGSAVDAAIAAQAVLGLVEPQSSGIGGGAFLLHYNAETKALETYDGRETAPADVTDTYLRTVDGSGTAAVSPTLRESGRSIGVPGVIRMLERAHADHGAAEWKTLFDRSAYLAREGFAISPRMASSVEQFRDQIARQPDAAAYFLTPEGKTKEAGTLLANPQYAETVQTIASEGSNALHQGPIADAIVNSVNSSTGNVTPGTMTTEDLSSYQAVKREPVCAPYRGYEVCGMAPPSSGGITVASTLGILDSFPLGDMPPRDKNDEGGFPAVESVHYISEAERLAYADRDAYIADTDFQSLPGGSPAALIDGEYLKKRAALIDPAKTMGTAKPGVFDIERGRMEQPENGTSHISIVDKKGNVVSMTTSVESAFGSFHFTNGFLLNNQLSDFALDAVDADGKAVANRIEPRKRPRSSMAPTIVFTNKDQKRDSVALVTGSPGGGNIIQYVVKTLVGVLDWKMNPQEAVSMIDFGAANTPTTNVGGEHPNVNTTDDGAHDALVQGLRERGHKISLAPQSSGLSAFVPDPTRAARWIGGSDPRREGTVEGG